MTIRMVSTGKLPKLAATVLVLALVAFLMAGCGEETPPTQPAAPTPTAGPSTTATPAKTPAAGQNRPEALIDQTVVPTDQTPQNFKKSLENRQPIIVTFYMVGPPDDYSVHGSVLTFESTYKGRVDFHTYQFNEADKYGDLVTLLKVNTTPTVVVINRQGKVHRAWTGFVDYKSIDQALSEVAK